MEYSIFMWCVCICNARTRTPEVVNSVQVFVCGPLKDICSALTFQYLMYVQVTVGHNLNYQLKDRLTIIDSNIGSVSPLITAYVLVAVVLLGCVVMVVGINFVLHKKKPTRLLHYVVL